MKTRKTTKRQPATFSYKSKNREISGSDDNRALIWLCFIDSLRWIIWPLLSLLLTRLGYWLSG
jgi:hypothetical protein